MAAYSGPLTAAFVKTHPTLVLDTRHFGLDFTDRVLKGIDDLDASVEGILLNSEDFHALSIMQKRYLHSIGSIYIDPPYNTDAGPIVYKNCYRHASWLAMMDNRLELSQRLMTDDAILCVTIDDIEVHNLRSLLDSVFTEFDLIGAVPIKITQLAAQGRLGFLFVMSTPSFMDKLISRKLAVWSIAKHRLHATKSVMNWVVSNGPTFESMADSTLTEMLDPDNFIQFT